MLAMVVAQINGAFVRLCTSMIFMNTPTALSNRLGLARQLAHGDQQAAQ